MRLSLVLTMGDCYIEDLTWVLMFYWFYETSWGKEIKSEFCRALYLFPNMFDKFNYTGAQMLDSIYHMTLRLLKNHIFGVKTSRFSLILSNVIIDIITLTENLSTTSGLLILLHGIISRRDFMWWTDLFVLGKRRHELEFWSGRIPVCSTSLRIFCPCRWLRYDCCQ